MVYQLMLKERDIALMGPHTLITTTHSKLGKRRILVSLVLASDPF